MQMTREALQARLEEAGAILLSIPGSARPSGLRSNMPDFVREAADEYGGSIRLRVQRPSPRQITRMEEALAWVSLIPLEGGRGPMASRNGGAALRRIVHARALVDPLSWAQTPNKPRHVYTWRQIGEVLGADYRAVKVWHGAALGLICNNLALRVAA
jgi:hypothetical protein